MISLRKVNVDPPSFPMNKLEIWFNKVAESHNRKIGNINYLFCDDKEILRVNREFLNHDYFTDIITFDYSNKNRISGDIFISLDTVKSNAEDLKVSYDSEILRVIIHGLLHLCGIGDKGPGEREIMEKCENDALNIWRSLSEY